MKKRAYIETYGCQMNISDAELMGGILSSRGYEVVRTPEEADLILVNSCAIREHAEQRVLGRVAQLGGLRARKPELVIGVTGCMAQRMGEDLLRKAPQVSLVMGPDGYRRLPDAVEAVAPPGVPPAAAPGEGAAAARGGAPAGRGGAPASLAVLELDAGEHYEGLELRRSSRVAAWVPVQRGCDHRCTFCVVPYVRGPEKNRAPEKVLEEIRELARGGVTEVTLLGQTVNSYRHGEWGFPRLLRAAARVPGIRRVRFASPHPNDVTPELVEVMASEKAVCEHLHLPLQAGNDRTLKRMLRRHTVADYLGKVELLRRALPELALSTDLMAAFPGETEAEFRDTLEVVREVRFHDAFTYRYSPREGTPATRFPPRDFVPGEVGKERLDRLIQATREIQMEINQGEVGRVEEVLVERRGKEPGFMLGRTRRGKVVVFPGEESLLGSYRRVVLARTTGATFAGEEVEPS